MIDVCVVGELNLDLILYGLPKDLEPDAELLASDMAFTLGSSSGIFAHNLAALGTRVGFISKIGSDPLGKMALGRLTETGIDTSHVKQSITGTATGLTVILPHAGHRYMLTYPGTMFEMEFSDIDMDYVLQARHLHLSSFFLHRALRPKIIDVFRQAKDAGLTTSLDTNDDPENLWGVDLLEVLKYVDLFFPNAREAMKIARTTDLPQALDFLAGFPNVIAMKCGADSSVCRAGDEQWNLAPPKVEMVDDVGAGDTFDAGFVHLYLRKASLEDCLAFANLCAAYSVTRPGGSEAFRDHSALFNFLREKWALMGRGSFPAED